MRASRTCPYKHTHTNTQTKRDYQHTGENTVENSTVIKPKKLTMLQRRSLKSLIHSSVSVSVSDKISGSVSVSVSDKTYLNPTLIYTILKCEDKLH